MKKIWIIQTRIQHYRLPIFDRLNKIYSNFNFRVLGHTLNGYAINGGKREYFINCELKNIFFFNYWKGILEILNKEKPEVLVMTASPRNISAWIIPIFRKFYKLETIGWSKINSDNSANSKLLHYFVKKIFYSLFNKMIVYGNISKKLCQNYR